MLRVRQLHDHSFARLRLKDFDPRMPRVNLCCEPLARILIAVAKEHDAG